jgi:internalin A
MTKGNEKRGTKSDKSTLTLPTHNPFTFIHSCRVWDSSFATRFKPDTMIVYSQAAFMAEYARCANRKVLGKIWEAHTWKKKELDLSGEKSLSDLSPLKDLTALKALNVSSTQVSDLSPLKDLTALKQLRVHSTQVRDLSPLTNLTALQELNVSNTQVSNLSPLINLTALKMLSVFQTQVSDLSPLTNLTALQQLWISNTQLSDLSPLTNLTTLQQLSVHSTQVSDLSPLTNLTALQRLYVSGTQVSDLSPLKGLIEKGIEVKWKGAESLDGIYIKDTPLSNPPIEIVKQGNAAILRYWKEQERSGTIQLNEARLLIVGQGGAGKTTLRKKLMDRQAVLPEAKDTTRGIEIEVLSFQNTEGGLFYLHIWDFGGQDIQHYAHQFFLSDSVVYVLVHSTREHGEEKGDDSNYWLSIIELLGKGSPTIIVQNEKFGHTRELKNIAGVRERFGNVRQFIKVDLSQAKDANYKPFKDLEGEIQHLACHLPHIGKPFSRSLIDVQEQLKILSKDKSSITWDNFEDLCGQQGITDTELMRDYARYFHQLGISLWFEEDEFLDQYVFLRPKWIIDALFELLYEGEALRKQAFISVKDVRDIWKGKEYKGMHGNLLRLMKNFEMCYEIVGDTPQYIVPQLLPADRAEYIPAVDATKVVFQYKFLPKGFLTRLTCRLHNRIDGNQVWNDAVQFKDAGGATVFAKETYAQNAIELIAEGNGKRQLLNEVINTLKDINTSSKFANLQVEILVPCPCKTCQKGDKRYSFDFDYLRRKLLKGQTKAECQVSLDDVTIKDILREVSPFSFAQIKEMITNGRVKEALNLLRGRYDERHEVILLVSQLSQLNIDSIRGLHTTATENVEYQKLSQRILNLLDVLASDD